MTLSTLARALVLSGVLFTGATAFAQEAEFIPGDILLMLEPGWQNAAKALEGWLETLD